MRGVNSSSILDAMPVCEQSLVVLSNASLAAALPHSQPRGGIRSLWRRQIVARWYGRQVAHQLGDAKTACVADRQLDRSVAHGRSIPCRLSENRRAVYKRPVDGCRVARIEGPMTKEGGTMPLHALVYCSQATPGLTLDRIDDLAKDAAAHNAIAGVTGVLLTDGRRFLQYLEGPEEGVALAYSRIINATSHLDIVELGRSEGGRRRFPFWPMRWLPVETEDLRIAEVSDWRGLGSRDEVDIDQVPTGIERVAQLVNPYVVVGPLDTWPRFNPLP